MQDNLMGQLRVQTAPEHRRLEAALDLMRDDLSLADYAACLRAFYGYIAPWEEAARGRIPASLLQAFDVRRKTEALRGDLRALERLGLGVADVRELTLPFDLDRTGADTTAAWLGAWYVIEGSMLGAQILAPHFAARFGLTPDSGLRYFSGYGARTGSMWNAFRALLVETIEPAAYATAIEGARGAFLRWHDWMIEAGVARAGQAETMEDAG